MVLEKNQTWLNYLVQHKKQSNLKFRLFIGITQRKVPQLCGISDRVTSSFKVFICILPV